MKGREKVYELSRTNPVVRAWLTVYETNREFTYEDVLEGMVDSLATTVADLTEQLIKLHQHKKPDNYQ